MTLDWLAVAALSSRASCCTTSLNDGLQTYYEQTTADSI
jgi:hypothetical protein